MPGELTVRRKHGFKVPLGAWVRGSARAHLEHSLSGERINRRGFFNPGTIEYLLATHQSGTASLSNRLNGRPTIEIWADKEL